MYKLEATNKLSLALRGSACKYDSEVDGCVLLIQHVVLGIVRKLDRVVSVRICNHVRYFAQENATIFRPCKYRGTSLIRNSPPPMGLP